MLTVILNTIQTVIIVLWTILATAAVGIAVIIYSFFSRTGNGPHLLARLF
jgi:hypothetical protein